MVDACVDHAVFRALVQDGYDVALSPFHGKPASPSDPEILELSAEQGRILVTDDLHIGVHLDAFIRDGGAHPGIIVAAKVWGIRKQIERIRHTIRNWDAPNMTNILMWAR